MIRTIYADRIDEVTKCLDRLAKKAERYGVPFSYTVGEEHPEQVAVHKVDYINHETYVDHVYTVSAIDIDIDCEGLICSNGWRVIAHIEHGDKGNIVTSIGDAEIKQEWYTIPARCEHCGTNRTRTYTFMVEHEDGTIRQVGKSCLKDYTGISPDFALMWATVSDLFPDMNCSETEWGGRKPTLMYPTKTILAHAYDSIKANGYAKSDSKNPTRDIVSDRVIAFDEPSNEGKEAADQMISWLIACGEKADADNAELDTLHREVFPDGIEDGDERYWKRYREIVNAWNHPSDLERSCVPLARSGYAKIKHIGRLSYIPVAYKKYMERKARNEERESARAQMATESNFVGNVGDRIEFVAVRAEFVTSWETMYGYTFLYRFADEKGTVYVWFASGAFDERPGMKVRGTVKKHDERDGIKQTVLTRCKVS